MNRKGVRELERSISVMVGKGSQRHNSRKFVAENVDANRTKNNMEYCDMPLRDVYHQLFDKAVVEYNAKQKRRDRMIDDYYDKIRTGKQEKLFHEIIFQVGNMNDMNAKDDNGALAAKILSEFMSEFQEHNPQLKVFSAHLHMDEETPHLHIDFVPFITGSKRGLDTRVSLKQALAAQGFKGGSRQETEWNQWVSSEKNQLAAVMERHGIEWEKLGTHEKHLSVLNYEKQERAKEVSQLEIKISENFTAVDLLKEKKEGLQADVSKTEESLEKVREKLSHLQKQESLISLNVERYDKEAEWQVPEPGALMSAKTYRTKTVIPFVSKLKDVIRSIVAQYLRIKEMVNDLERKLSRAYDSISGLNNALERVARENKELHEVVKDYGRVRHALGEEQIDRIINQAKAEEQSRKRTMRFKYER
jgi:peptidoglycan hydrolase CwlO-like protein